jgi:hypothetical protein
VAKHLAAQHRLQSDPKRTGAGSRLRRSKPQRVSRSDVIMGRSLASPPLPLSQTVETVEKALSDSRKMSRFGILQVSTEIRGAYAAVQSL